MKQLYTSLISMFILAIGTIQAQNIIHSPNQSYTQDFNSLSDSGNAAIPFNLENWELNTGQYKVSTGASNQGFAYSFGIDSSSDRSLGGIVSSSTTPIIWGTSFSNNSQSDIHRIQIQYTGKQWRRSNKSNKSTSEPLPDSLVFQYSLDASSITDNQATWNTLNQLLFTSPRIFDGTPSGTVLDGTLDSNQALLSFSLNTTFSQNQTIYFRWTYTRVSKGISGSRDGLAIDDFSATFYPDDSTTTPEDCDFDPDEFVTITGIAKNNNQVTIQYSSVEHANSYVIILADYPTMEDYINGIYDDEDAGELNDGVIYHVGDNLNGPIIVGITSDTTFTYTIDNPNHVHQLAVVPIFFCNDSNFYGELNATPPVECANYSSQDAVITQITPGSTTTEVQFSGIPEAESYLILVAEDNENVDIDVPDDGEVYTVGQFISGARVAYIGNDTNVTIDSLTPQTNYIVIVIPFLTCHSYPIYLLGQTYSNVDVFTTTVFTGIKNQSLQHLTIYPNPVRDNQIHLKLNTENYGKAQIQVFNVLGAEVYHSTQNLSSSTSLTLPNELPMGRYTLKIEQNNNFLIGSFIIVH